MTGTVRRNQREIQLWVLTAISVLGKVHSILDGNFQVTDPTLAGWDTAGRALVCKGWERLRIFKLISRHHSYVSSFHRIISILSGLLADGERCLDVENVRMRVGARPAKTQKTCSVEPRPATTEDTPKTTTAILPPLRGRHARGNTDDTLRLMSPAFWCFG
jgi:hypothetical protein